MRAQVAVLAMGGVVVSCLGTAPLPRRAIELNASGARALAADDLPAAEASLSVALEYAPRFVEAWVNLGYVELRRGNFELAGRDFAKARDLNPNLPAPWHALGVLADREGRGREAETGYRAALSVDPGFAPARANLARRLFARGQYENAREQFERLEQVAPRSPAAWAGHAEALLQLGRLAEAERVVAEGLTRAGEAPALTLLVGREHLMRSEWTEGEAALAPLVGEADRSVACAALAWIAVGRAARGDREGAQAAVDAALAIDPAEAVAVYARDRILRMGGATGSPQGRPDGR